MSTKLGLNQKSLISGSLALAALVGPASVIVYANVFSGALDTPPSPPPVMQSADLDDIPASLSTEHPNDSLSDTSKSPVTETEQPTPQSPLEASGSVSASNDSSGNMEVTVNGEHHTVAPSDSITVPLPASNESASISVEQHMSTDSTETHRQRTRIKVKSESSIKMKQDP